MYYMYVCFHIIMYRSYTMLYTYDGLPVFETNPSAFEPALLFRHSTLEFHRPRLGQAEAALEGCLGPQEPRTSLGTVEKHRFDGSRSRAA